MIYPPICYALENHQDFRNVINFLLPAESILHKLTIFDAPPAA